MNAPVPTSLYRHFAADGSLLYVGISLSWPARTKAHSHHSRWFEQVARVEIEQLPSREGALTAEREAIKREKPRFNVVHNCGDAPKAMRRKAVERWVDQRNPLVRGINGPHAIVGPALVYSGDRISVLVAHGEFGTSGELTEIVLGELFPELPSWTDACDTVLTIRRPNDITMTEARSMRASIIATLRLSLRVVQAYETDLALATAYATQFPSSKSRQVLDEVAAGAGGKSAATGRGKL